MENSKIGWTDNTFNPWLGCTKVSEECAGCYAENEMSIRLKRCEWGKGGERVLTSESTWKAPLTWDRKAARLGIRYRVFCASLCDVFDEEVSDCWRDILFETVIQKTPNLDWLLLTKRPVKARSYLRAFIDPETKQLPPNWWFGVSVGVNKNRWRIDVAADIPARIRFVSAEPLLEELDVRSSLPTLHWVITGGESKQIGHQPRIMRAEWARGLRDQCVAANVPFFFKQWGAHNEAGEYTGKKKIGHLLDGEEWSQIPA